MAEDPLPHAAPEPAGVNSIEPGRTRKAKAAAAPEKQAGPEPETEAAANRPSRRIGDLPEAIARRFVGEPAKSGAYVDYYEGAGAKQPSFRDRGGKLEALQTDPATAAVLVAIAKHRDWTTIKVRGDDDFRREVWREAQAHGLTVQGFRPTARDREEVDARTTARPGPERPRDGEAAPASERRTGLEGKLVEVGEAPYQNRPGLKASPFIKVQRTDGEVEQVWGVGLPKALERSGAQVGDTVQVRRAGTEPVTVKVEERDADTGRLVRRTREVDRTRWEIEAQRFREAGPAERLADPAMRGAQARLNVVEAVARERLSDPAARQRVVDGAEGRVADHLAAGRQIEPPAARERADRDRSNGPERVRNR